ncbi:hypothetical protein ABZX85_07615 [Streptomyces sp. NPDC004539]|uniref:hypothetical protein n=1 Tax=Streptomyces sp. NPDC004539 TaxID=3154280 RepID=UPI0033BA75BD
MADSAEVDLLLFRWEGNRDRHTTGIAASAHSCGAARAEELRALLAPLLRVEGEQSRRPSVVRCFDPATGDAVVVHRRPSLDARGRESTVSRALVGGPELLTARDSVTLAMPAWEWLGVPDEASGQLARVPADTVRGRMAGLLPTYLGGVSYIRTPLEIAVAQLVRTPERRLTFLRHEVQDLEKVNYAPLLIWGVCAMLGEWLGDSSLTYASFDTQADARLRLVCVPEWPRSAVGGAGAERISFAEAPRDEAREIAARLVDLFLTEPGRPEALLSVLRGCPGPTGMGTEERLDALISGLGGGGRRAGAVSAGAGVGVSPGGAPAAGPVPEPVPEPVPVPVPVPVVPVVPVDPVVLPVPGPSPEPAPVVPVVPLAPVVPVAPAEPVVPVIPVIPVVPAPPTDFPPPVPDPLPPVAAYVPADPLPLLPPLPRSYAPTPTPTPVSAPAPTPRADRQLPHRTRKLGRATKYLSPEWWSRRPTRQDPAPVLARLTGLDRLPDHALCKELDRPDLTPEAARAILRALERRTRWRTHGEAVSLAGTVVRHGMFLKNGWRAELAKENSCHGGAAGAARMFRWAVQPYLRRPELEGQVGRLVESLGGQYRPLVGEFWRRTLFDQDPAPDLPPPLWRELTRTRPWEERPAEPPGTPEGHASGTGSGHPGALRPPTGPAPTPAGHRTPEPPDDTLKAVVIGLVLLVLFVLLILLLRR